MLSVFNLGSVNAGNSTALHRILEKSKVSI